MLAATHHSIRHQLPKGYNNSMHSVGASVRLNYKHKPSSNASSLPYHGLLRRILKQLINYILRGTCMPQDPRVHVHEHTCTYMLVHTKNMSPMSACYIYYTFALTPPINLSLSHTHTPHTHTTHTHTHTHIPPELLWWCQVHCLRTSQWYSPGKGSSLQDLPT